MCKYVTQYNSQRDSLQCVLLSWLSWYSCVLHDLWRKMRWTTWSSMVSCYAAYGERLWRCSAQMCDHVIQCHTTPLLIFMATRWWELFRWNEYSNINGHCVIWWVQTILLYHKSPARPIQHWTHLPTSVLTQNLLQIVGIVIHSYETVDDNTTHDFTEPWQNYWRWLWTWESSLFVSLCLGLLVGLKTMVRDDSNPTQKALYVLRQLFPTVKWCWTVLVCTPGYGYCFFFHLSCS